MHVKNMSAASTSGNLVGFLTCTLRRIIMEGMQGLNGHNQLVGCYGSGVVVRKLGRDLGS
ncbi:hypothetical protein Scep_011227 [Stephania cephalantha]|uniref:Uncharacterized protein n=1 Tax=Stephania cephalantha TaxID=152367 RepID=A0AAP0JCT9_9MAGN